MELVGPGRGASKRDNEIMSDVGSVKEMAVEMERTVSGNIYICGIDRTW